MSIVLGDHKRSVVEGREILIQAGQVKIHPKHRERQLLYDIALLRFSERIDFEKVPHIGPICLPSFQFEDYRNDEPAITVGWGLTNIEYDIGVGSSGGVLFFGTNTSTPADTLQKLNMR